MAILSATHISQSFGAVDIFSGVTVNLQNDGKVGLVGPNGIGKTTLLQILAGESSPSTGSIHIARGTKMGYLTQESAQAFANYEDGRLHTVYQEMRTIFATLIADGEELQRMETRMADCDLLDADLEAYSKLQQRFEAAGGYDYDQRIRRTLTGLGFADNEWEMDVSHLSGGQKTRLLLAKLLLEQPNLLIMDEPTNHLDVEAIEWLEGTLKIWDGAVLIVSHDRYFLDRVVNTIWEMSRSGMEQYRGNYSAYVQQREERWERQLIEHKELRERLDKEMDYIRRNIAGQRTQMAQGKLSRLSREVEAIHAGGIAALHTLKSKGWLQLTTTLNMQRPADRVGDLQQRINALPSPTRPLTLDLQLKASHRSGRQVLRSKKLTIGYPDHPLFVADDLALTMGECAALIGPNGVGKTTLLRTILGQIEPLEGELKRGASLEVGYFSQARDDLNGENSVLEEMLENSSMLISEARNYLGRFLFRGDDVHKRVKSLSGGERGRLALAFLTLQKANFLLLDEPTNHLDIPSQETLQTTLEQYDGTILLVSHDRYLVDRLATQIWDLDNGRLHTHPSTYQTFLARQEKAQAAQAMAAKPALTKAEPIAPAAAPTLSKNALRKRAKALHDVEEAITDAENHLATLTLAMEQATQTQNFDKIQPLSVEYAETETKLEALLEQWETFSDE